MKYSPPVLLRSAIISAWLSYLHTTFFTPYLASAAALCSGVAGVWANEYVPAASRTATARTTLFRTIFFINANIFVIFRKAIPRLPCWLRERTPGRTSRSRRPLDHQRQQDQCFRSS